MDFIDGLWDGRAMRRDDAEVEFRLAGNGRPGTIAPGLNRAWQDLGLDV
jgi:hypothetical protein